MSLGSLSDRYTFLHTDAEICAYPQLQELVEVFIRGEIYGTHKDVSIPAKLVRRSCENRAMIMLSSMRNPPTHVTAITEILYAPGRAPGKLIGACSI
jgi:hypothetical protein